MSTMDFRDIFISICDEVGTPLATRAKNLAEKEDWVGVLDLKQDPSQYVCAKHFAGDCQVLSLLKKYPGLPLPIDSKKVAEDKFLEAEAQCFQTNRRLTPLLDNLGHYGAGVEQLIVAWRKELSILLGRAPTFGELSVRFGPKSTYLDKGDAITVAHKLTSKPALTTSALNVLEDFSLTAWARYASNWPSDPQDAGSVDDRLHATRGTFVVRGSRFTTVPKDARTDRGICVEPSINMFYQLGVGRHIERRLGRVYHWHKTHIEKDHKLLAQMSSLDGTMATIDLSMASDTIAEVLVKLLLPPAWFDLVDQLRCRYTLFRGEWLMLEKFSSMGNGFTFELETCIFWTLTRAILRLTGGNPSHSSVFGDDIIVATDAASILIKALDFAGFKTNENKTFISGPFRESCGGDYFLGRNVRPFYLKKELNEPHEWISLANGLRRSGRGRGGNNDYYWTWRRILEQIPRQIRQCRGPEDLGDLVIHDDQQRWNYTTRSSVRYFKVWRPVSRRMLDSWDQYRPGVVFATALYGAPSGYPTPVGSRRRSYGNPRALGGSWISGYRFGRAAHS